MVTIFSATVTGADTLCLYMFLYRFEDCGGCIARTNMICPLTVQTTRFLLSTFDLSVSTSLTPRASASNLLLWSGRRVACLGCGRRRSACGGSIGRGTAAGRIGAHVHHHAVVRGEMDSQGDVASVDGGCVGESVAERGTKFEFWCGLAGELRGTDDRIAPTRAGARRQELNPDNATGH